MAKRRNGGRTSRGYYDDMISISKRGLAIALGVVILLLGVAATVFCWGASDSEGHWAKNPTITEWFNYWGKGAPTDDGNGDENNGDENPPAGAAIVAYSLDDGTPIAEGGTYAMPKGVVYAGKSDKYVQSGTFSLTATLSNQYINGEFDWGVKFADEAAQGTATDHVQVVPTADGSATVNVTFLSKFSSQILITATLRGSDKSDSCTVDCLKSATMSNFQSGFSDFDDGVDYSVYVNFSDGTITGNFLFTNVTTTLTDSFVNAFKNYLTFDVTLKPLKSTTNLLAKVDGDYVTTFRAGNDDSIRLKYSDFIQGFDSFDEAHKQAIYYAWYKAWNNINTTYHYNATFDFSIIYSFQGIGVSTFTESDLIGGRITGDFMGADATPDVNLNQNIIF